MYARVSEFTGTNEQMDASTRQAEEITHAVDAMPGALGMYHLVDREAGRALAITLWDSEEAMRTSELRADQIREGGSQAAGTAIAGVGHFEVVVNTARIRAGLAG